MATDGSAAPPPPLYSIIEEWPETPAGPGERRSSPDSTQRLRRRKRQGRWPSLERERALWAAGYRRIAGADEVGTGAIAGPVVAAAVVLPLAGDFGADIAARLWEVRDSKCITTERKRQRLAALVRAVCQADVGVGVVSVEEWEALRGDLVQASRLAVRRALGALPQPPDYVLLDGEWQVPGVDVLYEPIPGGDGRCLSIAAASLVAKVSRDELMHALDAQHPEYAFGQHKGYPTPAHFAAKMRLGPIPGVHREAMSWPRISWAGTPPRRQS